MPTSIFDPQPEREHQPDKLQHPASGSLGFVAYDRCVVGALGNLETAGEMSRREVIRFRLSAVRYYWSLRWQR